MKSTLYLAISVLVFLTATMGSDVVARTSIGGETVAYAVSDHLHWASVQFVGTLMLASPFVAIAAICSLTEKRAQTRGVVLIFATAMVVLTYFYFTGYQASQNAMIAKKWTAATLSIGLLPFFVGIPVILAVILASAMVAKFDQREPKS